MFKRKNARKGLTMLLFLSVVVSVFGSSLCANAAGKEVYRRSYKKYVKQMQKKSKKQLYYAIINASDGKMAVLLITDGIIGTDTGSKTKYSAHADVYSYSDSKVVYITRMQSTGSGYPLLKKGKYIFSGFHHSSQRLMVSGDKGYMDEVDGFGLENTQCHKTSWVVANGKKKDVTKTDISAKKADKLDYYIHAYNKGSNEIKFKKVK